MRKQGRRENSGDERVQRERVAELGEEQGRKNREKKTRMEGPQKPSNMKVN